MRLIRFANWFFFSRFDPAPLGLFRIALGLLLIAVFVALYPNWTDYYGPGGMRPEPSELWGWSVFAGSPKWLPTRAFWWVGMGSAAAFTVGWHTRFFTVSLYLLQSSMSHTGVTVVHGDDMVIRMLLFYGMFAPLGHRYSVDSARARQSPEPPRVWPLRLMQINIALVYAFSLPRKLLADPSWSNGEALYWVLMSTLWNRWPIQSLFYDGTLSRIMTLSTVAVEASFPILIWFPRARIPVLAAIASFHLGLAVLLQNVSFFSLAMLCSFTLFLPSAARGRDLARPGVKTQKNGGYDEYQTQLAACQPRHRDGARDRGDGFPARPEPVLRRSERLADRFVQFGEQPRPRFRAPGGQSGRAGRIAARRR